MTTSETLIRGVLDELNHVQAKSSTPLEATYPKVYMLMQAYREAVKDALRLEKTIHTLTKP